MSILVTGYGVVTNEICVRYASAIMLMLFDRNVAIRTIVASYLLMTTTLILVDLSRADDTATILKDKWTAMTNSLKGGDTEGALKHIFPRQRAEYRAMFDVLRPKLKAITETEVDFKVLEIREHKAVAELTTKENGDLHSYQVIFVKDGNGNWWIYEY